MKSFTAISTFFFISTASEQIALEKTYGPTKSISSMLSWDKRTPALGLKNPEYYNMRTRGNCVFPINVVLVQDATASFADDVAIMRETQLKAMIEAFSSTHPNSRFSLVTFRDKPIFPFGDQSDFCQRFLLPLTADGSKLDNAYSKVTSLGGADGPENQFGALLATAQSQTPGWSNDLATNLIVLSTDAQPHFANDGFNIGLAPFSGRFNETGAAAQCVEQYYPSPDQVKNSLVDRQAYLAQLIFDSDWQNGLVKRSWEWFNNYIGQTPTFLEPLANDASNYWEVLSAVLTEIEQTECPPILTTTTAPIATTAPLVTTEGIVTEVGGTQTTPMETVESSEAVSCPGFPCNGEAGCACAEVIIKLAHRPKKLSLNVEN